MHVCTEAYPRLLSFKAQGFPQIERGGGGGGGGGGGVGGGVRGGGRCLAGCHVVARTLAYHPVCIWGSLVKFQVIFFVRFTDVSLPDVFRGPGASVHMLSRSPVSLTPDPSLSCTYSVLYVF